MKRRFHILTLICMAVAACILSSCNGKTVEMPHGDSPRKYFIVVIHNLNQSDESFFNLCRVVEKEFSDTSRYKVDYSAITEAYYPWVNEDYSGMVLGKLDKMQKLGWKPDLFILYSDQISHAAARVHHPLLDNTPVIFTQTFWPDHDGLLASRNNFTGFRTPLGISQTVDLMKDLGCSPWVITNLDDSYLDGYLREDFQAQLGGDAQKYNLDIYHDNPDHYVPVNERRTDVTTIIPLNLKTEDPRFDNKFMLNCQESGCSYLKSKFDRSTIISINNPVRTYYSLTPETFGLNVHPAMGACGGGWFVSLPTLFKEVHRMADQILVDGVKPSDIPWKTLEGGEYWLDWNVLKSQYSYGNELPKYAKVLNLKWRDRNRFNRILAEYWPIILVLFVWLVLMTIAMLIYFKYQSQKRELLKQGERARIMLAHLDASLAAANCHFFRGDPDGRITFSNGFSSVVGKEKMPSTMHAFVNILPEGQREQFISAISAMPEGNSRKVMRLNCFGHCFDVTVQRIRERNSAIVTFGIMCNIDSAVEAEKKRKEAFRIEEQSNMKRAFLASMGHEIRTPLNAIIGYSRLLFDMYDDLTPEEKATYSTVIDKNTEQLLSLIDGVITYSEDNGKEPDIALSRKHVGDLMEELYMTYRVIVPANLRFEFSKGSDGDYIMVNRGSMLQIVSNLMNNAVKFTKEGTITLGWREEDGKAVIFVKDTGCGIAPEFLDSVFVKYTKASHSTEGAGIGLSLCKKLTEKMDGEIRVSSTLGEGSCFEVLFKLEPQTDQA